MSGVVKYDLAEKKIIGRISYGKGKYGGECVFVPRKPFEIGEVVADADEDDGFLLTYVVQGDISELWIMDARTMAEEPLARVQIPYRIPYGFHGKFITAQQIAAQVDATPAQQASN